jgi:hypothetical protein
MNYVSAEGWAKMRSHGLARVAAAIWDRLLAGVGRVAARPATWLRHRHMGFRILAVVASVALAMTAAGSVGQAQAATTAGIPLTWPGGDFVATYDYSYMSLATVDDFVDNEWPKTVGLSPDPALSDLFQATWKMVYGHTTTPPPQPPLFTGGSVTVTSDGFVGSIVKFDIPALDFQALAGIPDSLHNFLVGIASGVGGGLAGVLTYGVCGSKFFPGGRPADASQSALQICNALSTGVVVGAVGAAMATKLNTGETSGFPIGGFLGAVAGGGASAYLTATTLSPMVPQVFSALFSYLGVSAAWVRLLAYLSSYMSAADLTDVGTEMQALSNSAESALQAAPNSIFNTPSTGNWPSAWLEAAQGQIANADPGGTSTSSTNCMDAYGSNGDAWPTPGAVPGQPVAIDTCDGSMEQSWVMWGNGSISIWGLCLDANGGSLVTISGSQWAQATLQYCDGSASQVWYQYGGQLVNGASQYCLDDPASDTTPGTQLILHPCQGNLNQKWALPAGGQYASAFGAVKNPVAPLLVYCMDAYGSSGGASPGQKVAINTCGGTQPQSWTVGTNGTVQAWGLCLDAAGGGTDSVGDPLATLQLCDGSSSQAWTVAGKELINSGDSECLDDPGSNTAAGTQLILFQCKGGANQFWVLPGSDPSSSAATAWTGGQVIADPAYIDPTSDIADWNTLIGSPTAKLGVVVANVLNGPGSTAVSGWATAIDGAHASGKKVLGYVDTGYLGLTGRTTRLGSTAMADWVAQIEQDINAWYNLYGNSIDGIFFDDGYNACGAGNEYPAVYQAVNQYEKVNHPGSMTVLNPGIAVPQCYEGAADVLLTFEGSEATYESSAYQALGWTPKSPSEIWHIIYGVAAADVSLVDETSQTRGAGYVYITGDVPANPYDTIPSFWSAEEADVPGGTPGVSAAAAYTTGAALPAAPSGLTVTSSDYTSAALTWTAGANVANYLVYLNGQEVASLPSSMTAATIGGLTPGGTAYTLDVVAQGVGGDLSAASNSVSVTTLSLPGGQTIANPAITAGSGTVSYSADFYVPYSFRRVYISPPATSTESCWWMADNNPVGDPLCARWLIENTTLLVYAGSGSDWTWTPVAYLPPTINGYIYTWTVPASDLGDATGYVGFEGQGYGPLTDIYTTECANCQ